MEKRANLKDVAKTANVSVATVSRVLNNPDIVQSDTKERVQQAIADLNFHRNPAARAINSGRSMILGALIPSLDNDIFAQTIETIETCLGEAGYSLVVATTGEDPIVETKRANELLDLGVEGLFLSGVTHSAELMNLLTQRRVPAVALSYYDPEFTYPTIGYDNRAAGRLALEHLLDLGRRRIAVVHGPTDTNDRISERVAGVTLVRKDLQQSFFATSQTSEGGALIAAKIVEDKHRFDAILCVSDVMAIGVVFELLRRGIVIPDDIAVMGIHDLPVAKSLHPRLSTIRLPARRMAAKAASALIEWLDNGTKPHPHCFSPKLIRRETT